MKIETTIKPRRNGTVNVVIDGVTYLFAEDDQGRLVADVESEEHLSYLLGLGDFLPADEDDFEVAQGLIDSQDDDEEGDDDGDEAIGEGDLSALPLEENTPPSGKKPRKVK